MAVPAINIISLCTGGYGLDFGIELAMPGARSVVLVEREAFAVARLVSAMQAGLIRPAAIWDDARTFDGRPWRGLVDGVIGGIPCQPHSFAGRRRGADDPRDLWSAARRIIVQSGAWWVLIENVPGMLAAPKGQRSGAERVLRDLQRLGFAVEGGLFSAAEVGGKLWRDRVFILAVTDNARREGAEWDGQPCAPREGRAAARSQSLRPNRGFGPPGPDQVNKVPRDLDGVARSLVQHRPHALRLLGNGVVPLAAAHAVRTLCSRLAARGSAGAAFLVRMMEDEA